MVPKPRLARPRPALLHRMVGERRGIPRVSAAEPSGSVLFFTPGAGAAPAQVLPVSTASDRPACHHAAARVGADSVLALAARAAAGGALTTLATAAALAATAGSLADGARAVALVALPLAVGVGGWHGADSAIVTVHAVAAAAWEKRVSVVRAVVGTAVVVGAAVAGATAAAAAVTAAGLAVVPQAASTLVSALTELPLRALIARSVVGDALIVVAATTARGARSPGGAAAGAAPLCAAAGALGMGNSATVLALSLLAGNGATAAAVALGVGAATAAVAAGVGSLAHGGEAAVDAALAHVRLHSAWTWLVHRVTPPRRVEE